MHGLWKHVRSETDTLRIPAVACVKASERTWSPNLLPGTRMTSVCCPKTTCKPQRRGRVAAVKDDVSTHGTAWSRMTRCVVLCVTPLEVECLPEERRKPARTDAARNTRNSPPTCYSCRLVDGCNPTVLDSEALGNAPYTGRIWASSSRSSGPSSDVVCDQLP